MASWIPIPPKPRVVPMIHLPADLLALVHDLAHAVGPRSDGGRKVTIAEAEQIGESALKLAADIAEIVKAGRSDDLPW